MKTLIAYNSHGQTLYLGLILLQKKCFLGWVSFSEIIGFFLSLNLLYRTTI